jgi:cobalt transporter subunit CbtA
MLFRQLIYAALGVGLLAGVLLTLVQQFQVMPLILAAEQYESTPPSLPTTQTAHSHHERATVEHGHQAWSPEDGNERLGFSLLSNVLAGIGMAMTLLGAMGWLQARRNIQHQDKPYQAMIQTKIQTMIQGVGWGMAGFATFFVAPALGLPPEIPGIEAAPIGNRQTWWILTVLSTALSIALVVFAPKRWKAVGVCLLFVPHLIALPPVPGPEFLQTDPNTVAALTQLHHQFIVASTLSNFLYWILLGVASVAVMRFWIVKK